MNTKFLSGKLKGRDALENVDADIRIIKIDLVETKWWIHLLQDRIQWRSVVYMVMNFLVMRIFRF